MQAKRRTSLIAPKRQLLLTLFLVAGLDCATKSLALSSLGDEPVRVIGNLLTFHLRYNSGAAFSIATNRTTLLSAFSLAVATLILIRASRMTHRGWIAGAGLVVGGITGNMIDRIMRPPGALSGQVIDWIEIPHWPTFNLADSSIVIGAILVAVLVIRNIPPETPRADDQTVDHKSHKSHKSHRGVDDGRNKGGGKSE